MQYINNHIIKEQYITQNTIYLTFLNLKQQTLNFLNKLIQQFKASDLLIFIQTNFESIYIPLYILLLKDHSTCQVKDFRSKIVGVQEVKP